MSRDSAVVDDYNPVVQVRVVVIAKDSLARAGLVSRLAGAPGLVTVIADGPPEELEALAAGRAVDAVALDAGADGSGLRELESAPPALVLVGGEARASEALAAGARGILPRDAGAAELAAALVAVGAGLFVIDPDLAATLIRPRASAAPPGESLTPRELEVLQLLSLGLANKAIAARLGVSDHTAKFPVNSILAKLGASSRSEAIVRAARAGLVSI